MEVAPLPMTDPWSDRIQRNPEIDAQMLRGVPSEIAVNMTQVAIHHHGQSLNFRPYLHLQGRIEEIVPDVKLPYGIEKLPFKEESGPSFDAFYEFTDEQLSVLVTKGYFTENFQVPAEMSETVWDLPGKADYLMVYPETSAEPPLVFVSVADRNEMTMTQASSEYDLHDYFPNYLAEQDLSTEQVIQETEAEESLARSNELSDLFEGHEFEAPNELHMANDFTHTASAESYAGGAQADPELPHGVFETLVDQVKARQTELFGEEKKSLLDADEDELTSEANVLVEEAQEEDETDVRIPRRPSVRDLYRDRMAPSVAEAFAAEGKLLSEINTKADAADAEIDDPFAEIEGDDLFEGEIEAEEELDVEPVEHPELNDEELEERAERMRRKERTRAEAHRDAEKAADERAENESTDEDAKDLDLS